MQGVRFYGINQDFKTLQLGIPGMGQNLEERV
jgi:hypothetical protein